MKKLFTLAAALMASLSLMAAEPNYESSLWGADDFATVIADHDGITISTSLTKWGGNLSGTTVQYLNMGGGTDMSADAPSPYFAISATSAIDSVEIYWAPNGGDASNLAWAAWTDAANLLKQDVDYLDQTAEFTGSKSVEGATWQKIDLSGKDVKAIMIARQIKNAKLNGTKQSNIGKNKTVNIIGVRVWAGPAKEVKSTLVELTNVKINGEALDAQQVAFLKNHNTLALTNEYVEAPTVTFTATTTVTYTDDTQKVTDADIPVVATEVGGKWQAQTTINVNTYTVTAIKPTSYTVNYYDGETLLGTETVKAGADATKYAEYAVKPLAQFVAWYTDKALTTEVTSWTINANTNFYGKWTKAYAKSMNIEQIVLDKGVKFDIATAMADAGYDLKNSKGGLDSLNDEKTERNEPYLGLKLKQKGDYISLNLKSGDSLAVKLGHNEGNLMVISEGDTAYISKDIHEIRMKADDGDEYVQLITTTEKTLVFKQIMINKDFDTVILPAQTKFEASVSEAIEHGTVTLGKDKKSSVIVNEGDSVIINLTPEEGYKVGAVWAGNAAVLPVAGVYAFVMPGQNTVVGAEFILAGDTTYIISISDSIKNGYVVPDKYQAKAGDTITLTITPAEGYELEDISLEGIDLAIIVEGNTAKFVMPKQNVTVLATFKAKAQTLYTVTLGTYEHGTVAFIEPNAENKYAEGEDVRLSVIPDEGYELEAISLEGIDLAIPVVDGVATFKMPAQDVVVLATFKENSGEGIDNTEAGVKAVKVMREGKLFIEKNGVIYNAQGVIVK